MILDNKEIEFCKRLISRISLNAFLNNDSEIVDFTTMMMEMINFYESHMNSWEYTSHHDRQAMAFIKRLAITESKYKNRYPEDFEDAFFHIIDDYPAIKRRYYEWLRGYNL